MLGTVIECLLLARDAHVTHACGYYIIFASKVVVVVKFLKQ